MKKHKNPNAEALGRLGAKARMVKMSASERQRVAQSAALSRWQHQPRCACGCGLTLATAKLRHPRRAVAA